MAGIRYVPATALLLYLVILSEFRSTTSKSTGFSMRLISRDSPESPIYPGNLTEIGSAQRLINFSKARTALGKLQRSTPNGSFDDEKALISLSRDSFYYMGEVLIGKPAISEYLLIDTGGALVWTQCQPCIYCYNQKNKIYDSQASITYQELPCDHPLCTDEHSSFQCINGKCSYSVSYGLGKGPTKGIASMELFTFQTDRHGNTVTLKGIVFGCSYDNPNFDEFERNGFISGILGLNLSPISLFSQLSDQMEKVFSYCVVPFNLTLVAPNIFRFGDDVFIPPGHIPTVPYFTLESAYNFYLNLMDISIGDRPLGLPNGTFDPSSSHFFIDSATPMTQLVTTTIHGIDVYQTVMTALQQHYDSHHLERINSTNGAPNDLELCYRKRADFNDFQSMTFHFEGGDYVVAGEYMNIDIGTSGIFCVAILPAGGDTSVLGAIHQQNMRIIHNGNINAIHFYPEDCADDPF